jgi:[ribosomal protein S18]-alanine N-acetyltransferase
MSSRGEPARDTTIVLVRPMVASDSAAVLAILQESPEASPWSECAILESAGHAAAWVAEQGGALAGFLIGRVVADEFEILNMAVARAHRRRGIAGQLVQKALRSAGMAGGKRAHLEVRASNEAAISVYRRQGFKQYGRRVQYYQYPPEDACLFSFEISSME